MNGFLSLIENDHALAVSFLVLFAMVLIVAGAAASSQVQGYSESKSYNYQAVPLLRPEEVMQLPADLNLIMRTGHAPVKAGQLVWHKERVMKNLTMVPSVVPIQKLTLEQFLKDDLQKNR